MKKIIALAALVALVSACTGKPEELAVACTYDMANKTKTCEIPADEYAEMAVPNASASPTVVGTRTVNGVEYLVMSDQKLIPVGQATAHAKK